MKSRFRTYAPVRGIGEGFTASAPSCPPGQHWETDPTTIRGLGACVPDAPFAFRTTPGATLGPAPAPASPAPTPDAAPAPAFVTAPAPTCPEPWPWWWLLVAAAAGAAAGVYVRKNTKKTRENAGRMMNAAGGRIVENAGRAAMGRILA